METWRMGPNPPECVPDRVLPVALINAVSCTEPRPPPHEVVPWRGGLARSGTRPGGSTDWEGEGELCNQMVHTVG